MARRLSSSDRRRYAGPVDALGVVVERAGRIDEDQHRAKPWWCAAKLSMVSKAPPARSQSAGVLKAELIIMTVGSRGGGCCRPRGEADTPALGGARSATRRR